MTAERGMSPLENRDVVPRGHPADTADDGCAVGAGNCGGERPCDRGGLRSCLHVRYPYRHRKRGVRGKLFAGRHYTGRRGRMDIAAYRRHGASQSDAVYGRVRRCINSRKIWPAFGNCCKRATDGARSADGRIGGVIPPHRRFANRNGCSKMRAICRCASTWIRPRFIRAYCSKWTITARPSRLYWRSARLIFRDDKRSIS